MLLLDDYYKLIAPLINKEGILPNILPDDPLLFENELGESFYYTNILFYHIKRKPRRRHYLYFLYAFIYLVNEDKLVEKDYIDQETLREIKDLYCLDIDEEENDILKINPLIVAHDLSYIICNYGIDYCNGSKVNINVVNGLGKVLIGIVDKYISLNGYYRRY
jgi:hypothetical protein